MNKLSMNTVSKINPAWSSKIWHFIGHFLKPYKAAVVLFIILSTLAGLWGPFNSMLIKYMINLLSSTASPENIALLTWPAILLVLNFIVFDNITWRTIGYLCYRYAPQIKNQMVSETFNYVLGSSQQFFQDNLSGRIANQITTLAENIERILFHHSANFIRGASLLIVALISMFYVNPIFTLILALWFLVFSFYSMMLSKDLIHLSDNYMDKESTISGQVVDSISNVNNVRMFARRPYEVLRLNQYLLDSQKSFQIKELFLIKLNIVQGMLIAIMLGFMVYFLIRLYAQDQITIGDFALILGLGMEVGHIAWYTMSIVDEYNQAVGKCKQAMASLFITQDVQDRPGASDLIVSKGQIAFSDVKFQYQGAETLFQNKSVTIKAGQKVGLVGYSGSGKSTFVNLILRFYDILEGRLQIDDQDIDRVTNDSLRNNIALIPQDPTLFHRSLMDNIRYGRIDASDEEVISASKKAHAHEFISQLPQGYESPVGERGVKLSGGQRQRIAIARAILKNAPILILDEATSQLDSVTENLIQESLWALMQDKTTIVIAHRLSTLLHMDRILVFEQGKIIQDGRHQDLLQKSGLYKTLWNAQVGGFLPDHNHENE